jgi:hypothetical protein
MNDQQYPQDGPSSSPAASPRPDARPLQRGRRAMAAWGGILAGLGAGIGLATLMHVIVQASPESLSSDASGSMFVALVIAGPLIGLGLGLAFAGLVPGYDATSQRGGPRVPGS